MPSFDTRVPAVLVRLDRNPFHHGTLGAARSLGRAGVPVHAVLESPTSPAARSRYVRSVRTRPEPLSPSALPLPWPTSCSGSRPNWRPPRSSSPSTTSAPSPWPNTALN